MTAKKKPVFDLNLKIVLYLLLPLLLLPPFFRGLYFAREADVAHLYTALVLAVYAYLRRDHVRLPRNLADWAWLGLLAAYLISNFVALNHRDAFEGLLMMFNFFLIYWLLANTVTELKDFRTVFAVMFIAGFGVALFGLGTAFGTFWFNGAFLDGMVYSTLQYHNATAIFLLACSVLGLYLAAVWENIWVRVAVTALNFVVIMAFYGAGSRGAMLVAPVALVLLLAGISGYRFKVFLNFLALLLPFFVTAKRVLTFGQYSEGAYWGWLFLGIVLAVGCQLVVEKFLSMTRETRKKIVIGAGIAVITVCVGLVLVLGSRVMPVSITDRLTNLDLKQANVQERFYFYRDALEIIRDYPVFGVGRGGWKSLYWSYQDFAYNSTEVHSFPLQVWVDTGTVGFLFYVLLWVGFALTVIRALRRAESAEMRAVAWTAAVAAVSISAHSVIDFSLSLGSVAILMFGLMGLVRGVERLCAGTGQAGKTLAGPLLRKITGFSLAGALFLISASLYLAAVNLKDGADAAYGGDTDEAVAKFELAARLDPFDYQIPMYLSGSYARQAFDRKDWSLADKAVEAAQKAVRLNERATDPLWNLAWVYYAVGRPDQAVAVAEEAQRAMPWWISGYEQLSGIYVNAAGAFIQMGQKENARMVLDKTMQIPERIQDQLRRLGPDESRNWVRAPKLEVNDRIKKAVDDAGRMRKTL